MSLRTCVLLSTSLYVRESRKSSDVTGDGRAWFVQLDVFFLGKEDVGIWDFTRQASPSEKNLHVVLQVFIDGKSS